MHKLRRIAAAAGLSALVCAALTVPVITLAAAPASAAGCGGTPKAYKGPDKDWVLRLPPDCPGSTSQDGGNSGSSSVCGYYTPASQGILLAPPYKAPKGYIWLIYYCPQYLDDDDTSFPPWQLAKIGGPLSTRALALEAYAELAPPTFAVSTAPVPAGTAVPVGITGIPEWFWIPADAYTPITKTVALAGLSATVTATPGPLQITLGDGQKMTCQGPGTPYRQGDSPQASDCTHIYQRPSYDQPGSAYAVTVSVIWNATWKGTPTGGGALPSITVPSAPLALTVDSAQADNTASP